MQRLKIILFLFGLTGIPVLACGPFFPPSYLEGDGNAYVAEANLAHELKLIAESCFPREMAGITAGELSTRQAEAVDFRRALADSAIPQDVHSRLETAYFTWQSLARDPGQAIAPLNLPPKLREFELYVLGVRAMHERGPAAPFRIPEAWQELLTLAAPLRRFRTVWVHYMVGNLHLGRDEQSAAAQSYRRVLEAVQAGFVDTCGLAAASFGKLAVCAPTLPARTRAAVLAAVLGDDDALYRIRHGLRLTKLSEAEIGEVLDDPVCREVVAARFMSYPRSNPGRFLALLGDRTIQSGERLAFLAYRTGQMELTEQYLAVTPDESLLKWWLRAKVQRWQGDNHGAAASLRRWLALYAESPVARQRLAFVAPEHDERTLVHEVRGCLGTVLVDERDFLEALHCFVEGGSWPDAAFVAERLLSTSQLRRYVEATCSGVPNRPEEDHWFARFRPDPDVLRAQLRYLLGRRLAREQQYTDAVPCLPGDVARDVQRYAALLAHGRAAETDPQHKAVAFYNAAKLLRWRGMEMMGTERYPDAFIYRGHFSDSAQFPDWFETPDRRDLVDVAISTRPHPQKRFHYRYLAANLMQAAAEIGNDPDFKAAALYLGGCWLRDRDPAAADPIHKQLAGLGSQPLAKLTAENHWFPRHASAALDAELGSVEPRTLDEIRALGRGPFEP